MMNQSEIINALKNNFKIPEIQNRNYWLIRTETGKYYNDFAINDYVAIDWNYISIDIAKTEKIKTIRKLIEKHEEQIDKQQTTIILNKVNRFVNVIKENDIIIIPSENSESISIGICLQNEAYEDKNYIENYKKDNDTSIDLCPFYKRRKVKWLKNIKKANADIYLLQMLYSHHAIFNVNEYAPFINRCVYPAYIMNNELHYTFKAGNERGLSLKEWTSLFDFFNTSFEDYSDKFDIELDPDDIQIKANIHSPGYVEIIAIAGLSMLALGFLIFAINHFVCGGKTKILLKIDPENKHLDFSVNAESPGLLGRKLQFKSLELSQKQIDQVKILEEKVGIEMPPISGISPKSTNDKIGQ